MRQSVGGKYFKIETFFMRFSLFFRRFHAPDHACLCRGQSGGCDPLGGIPYLHGAGRVMLLLLLLLLMFMMVLMELWIVRVLSV